jgi:putative transposase
MEHNGYSVTNHPNQIWGTGGNKTWALRCGDVTVFAADHCSANCAGIHAVKRTTRLDVLKPIRRGMSEHFGGFCAKVVASFIPRHGHGTQYLSNDFQDEIRASLGV